MYAVDRNGPVWRYTENGWENVANISYDWSVSDISLKLYIMLCKLQFVSNSNFNYIEVVKTKHKEKYFC